MMSSLRSAGRARNLPALAWATLATLAAGSPLAWSADPPAGASTPRQRPTPPADRVPGSFSQYGAKDQATFREAVLKADRERIAALRAGNTKKLDDMYAFDLIAINGPAGTGQQYLDKAQFLALAKHKLPTTVDLSEQDARLFGAVSDLAIVNGVLKDNAIADDPGIIYTAIYVRQIADGTWQLARYLDSTRARLPFPPAPPVTGPNWTTEGLGESQLLAVGALHDYLDELARRDVRGMEKTLGDSYWEIHATSGSDIQRGKEEFLNTRRTALGAPELIGMDQPDLQLISNYGDVGVIVGVRRDATGGAVYGREYTPVWRNVAYYVAVVDQAGLKSKTWRLEHYHATYVH
jgi:hypothetical protein